MATYTLEKLQEKLDKNLSWRKKELTIIMNQIDSTSGEVLSTSIRSGLTLLYAHWEGYIKSTSREYLKFLNLQGISCASLIDNLFILYLKKTVKDASQSNKNQVHAQIYNKIHNGKVETFYVDVMDKDIINTESNLSYEVMEDLLFSLGLEAKEYELKKHFIKDNLLDGRNKIAHGEYYRFIRKESDEKKEKEEYRELYREILNLIERFKDQILDAAIDEKYKKEIV